MTCDPQRSSRNRVRAATAAWAVISAIALAPLTGAETSSPASGAPLDGEQLVELLLALASDAPIEERVSMLYELAAADLTSIVDLIEEVARSPFDLPLRAASIEMLSRLSADQAQPLLEHLAADDPNPHVQALAAEALGGFQPPQPAPFAELEADLLVATEAADRRALVSQLGALEDLRAQDLLWRIAADVSEDPLVVATAVEGLSISIDRPDLAADLETLLSHHLTHETSPAASAAIRARLTDSVVVIPGEIVD